MPKTALKDIVKRNFFVAGTANGHQIQNLPIYGDTMNPIQFDPSFNVDNVGINIINKNNLDSNISGVFQITNVLTKMECQQFIDLTNALGYTTDAPVSLPYHIRHMSNCNWIVNDTISNTIFDRCKHYLPPYLSNTINDKYIIHNLDENEQSMEGDINSNDGYYLRALNNRFRFYKYMEGDYFLKHCDGSWPHTKIIDGNIIDDIYSNDRNSISHSLLTFLVLLSDDYTGGNTTFYDDINGNALSIKTPLGGVLCFFHGNHALNIMHSGELIKNGIKYMIRLEVIYSKKY